MSGKMAFNLSVIAAIATIAAIYVGCFMIMIGILSALRPGHSNRHCAKFFHRYYRHQRLDLILYSLRQVFSEPLKRN